MNKNHNIFFLYKPYGLYFGAFFATLFALLPAFIAAIAVIYPESSVWSWPPWLEIVLGMFGYILVIFSAIKLFQQAQCTRLVITSNGIEYHAPGYSIGASWEDVKSIKKPVENQSAKGLELQGGSIIDNRPLVLVKSAPIDDQFIPLLGFGQRWEEEKIGELLKKYKPSLFIDSEKFG